MVLDGTGQAQIRYTPTSGHGLMLDGAFALVLAGGPGRLWLVSAGATLTATGLPADELATLEAVRLEQPARGATAKP